jgi:hypothetical protein
MTWQPSGWRFVWRNASLLETRYKIFRFWAGRTHDRYGAGGKARSVRAGTMPDLSEGVQAAWQIAAAEVVKLQHDLLEPLHLFIGICSIEKLLSAEAQGKLTMALGATAALRAEWDALLPLFAKIGLSPATLRRDARSALGRGNHVGDDTRQVSRSEASRTALWRAAQLAEKSGASAINSAHLFAALLDDVWGAVATFLILHGVDVSALAAAARAVAIQRPAATTPPGVRSSSR